MLADDPPNRGLLVLPEGQRPELDAVPGGRIWRGVWILEGCVGHTPGPPILSGVVAHEHVGLIRAHALRVEPPGMSSTSFCGCMWANGSMRNAGSPC